MASSEGIIVKGDALGREALQRALMAAAPGMKVIIFPTGAAALSRLQRQPARLAVIGLNLPDIDGLELMARIVGDRLARHILTVADRRDQCSEYFCRHAGIDGLLDAEHDGEKAAVTAIRRVLAGKKHFRAAPRPAHDEIDLFTRLTPRELEVLALIGGGSDDHESSVRLRLSAKTVHVHRHRIMWKLEARNRSELIAKALLYGVVRFTPAGKLLPGLACARLNERLKTGSNGHSRK